MTTTSNDETREEYRARMSRELHEELQALLDREMARNAEITQHGDSE